MTVSRTVECFNLEVYRGHWMLRSQHGTRDDLLAAISKLIKTEPSLRYRVEKSTRRVIEFSQPVPTQARAHREAVAEAMVVRAQHAKLYKSGANGTELAFIPEEGVIK